MENIFSEVPLGLSYPADAALTTDVADGQRPTANSAVSSAVAAFQAATLAAARAAAAEEAVRCMDGEIDATRRRLRALDKRRLPWLAQALAELELSLEQAEQEDGTRLRRAVAADPEPRSSK